MKHLMTLMALVVAVTAGAQVMDATLTGNSVHMNLNYAKLDSIIADLQAKVTMLEAASADFTDIPDPNFDGNADLEDLFEIQNGPTTVDGTILGDTLQLVAGKNYFIEVYPGGFSHTYANGCCYQAAASLEIERTDGDQGLDWETWPSDPTSVTLFTVSPCESYYPQPVKKFQIQSNINQAIHFVGLKSTDCILGGSVTVFISE